MNFQHLRTMSSLWAKCYRGVSEAVEFGPSMPNPSEPQGSRSQPQHGLRCQAGLGGCFLVSPNRPERRNTQRSGDRSSGVLTKVKPPEQNPTGSMLMMTRHSEWRSSSKERSQTLHTLQSLNQIFRLTLNAYIRDNCLTHNLCSRTSRIDSKSVDKEQICHSIQHSSFTVIVSSRCTAGRSLPLALRDSP